MAKEKRCAALYVRVSTQEQAIEGYSLAAQERLLTDHCKQKRYEIYDIYRDEGISAKDIKHRPGMLRLLEDAKQKKFDTVLIWKLSRFSRSMPNLVTVCEELDRSNIMLVSYSEAFDSGTPAGRMVRSMLGTVAQFEREVTGENVILAMWERARRGKRTCSEVLGYDLDGKDGLKINDQEAEYVRFCFTAYLTYKCLSDVAKKAREAGYRGKRGKIPSPYSICTILSRPIYCGYNRFQGKLYKGNHKPLVSVDTYNRVQALLKRQGKTVGRHRIDPFTTIH
ncbi:recombinase family protein [Lacrimispora sp. NSJ-141]|uniref:Recombinase family protein n=1 Tax=Lientehia hominis TaxID=2897778 RepID=A0AAP2RKJ0_9FIRM|nr:recombinase family protein [Lientehia hominis]MCD2493651.1 recombinase family protein [Lientehia hominis]